VILDDPFDDPQGLEVPDKSPGPTKEMLEVWSNKSPFLFIYLSNRCFELMVFVKITM
jgi:hypothetical protein